MCASNMRSRVSYRFESIHRIRVDGRKRCENASSGREFFVTKEKKSCVFKRIQFRRDRPEEILVVTKLPVAIVNVHVSGCQESAPNGCEMSNYLGFQGIYSRYLT